MKFAGILAGGVGSRMETAKIPKQFLNVSGIPVFIRTIKTFLNTNEFDYIIVSINIDWKERYEKDIEQYLKSNDKIILVEGGNTRFRSLFNIVKKADEMSNNDDSIIVTHDCARIFVSEEIINNNLLLSQKYSMVTTSIPVIDTIIESHDGQCSNCVPDRSKLWADQGPQTFSVSKFIQYYAKIPAEDIDKYIEAGKLFLVNNEKIGIVKGSRFNFKITNDIDLKYAEFLIKEEIIQ